MLAEYVLVYKSEMPIYSQFYHYYCCTYVGYACMVYIYVCVLMIVSMRVR